MIMRALENLFIMRRGIRVNYHAKLSNSDIVALTHYERSPVGVKRSRS